MLDGNGRPGLYRPFVVRLSPSSLYTVLSSTTVERGVEVRRRRRT